MIEIDTKDSMTYKFYPVSAESINFKIKAPNDAHVALTSGPSVGNPMYEIFFGGWKNTKIAIRKNMEKPEVAEYTIDKVLDENEYRPFWVKFADKLILVGSGENVVPILSWPDPQLFSITHFGIRTCWGADGSWKITEQVEEPKYSFDPETLGTGDGTWVGANGGDIPPDAICAGTDEFGKVYVGRAMHAGGLLPGKVVPKHGVCYVPWGGKEIISSEYEVLCNCRGVWVNTSGENIPPNAALGGKTEDGETLYIGRAEYNNYLTPGKVQKSHGVCYIPFGGQEIAVNEYQILVLN